MLELPPHAFQHIRPLIQQSGMHGHLALVYEILEGRRPGLVYVDQHPSPNTAFLCGSSGFFFAFGEPDETMAGEIIARFWNSAENQNYTTLFGSNPSWNIPLERAFRPYGVFPEARLAFDLKSMPTLPAIPRGFSLAPITAELAQSILDGTGTHGFGIDPWFIRVAGGPEAYAVMGLGLALVCEDGIASLCGVCGLGGGEVEMEVGTVPAYRGRGLATIISAAFMHQCQEHALRPTYSCSSDNVASISIARRLGYVKIEEIQGYRLFDPGAS